MRINLKVTLTTISILFCTFFDNVSAQSISWIQSDYRIPTAVSNMGYATIDDSIYMNGGFGFISGTSDDLYEFNVSNNRWIKRPNMFTERYDNSLVAVNKNLYSIGGHKYKGLKSSANEMFDTKTKKWYTRAPLPMAIEDLEAIAIGGKIYAFGGTTSEGTSKRTLIYDTVNDKWTYGKDMPFPLQAMGIACIDTKIYLIGGKVNSNANIVYDTKNDSWQIKKSMPTGRSHLVTFSYGNSIYAVGGTIGEGAYEFPLGNVEVYDTAKDEWAVLNKMPFPRGRFAYGLIDDQVYIFGGWSQYLLFNYNMDIIKLD